MFAGVREINVSRQSDWLCATSSGVSSSRTAIFFLDTTPLYLYDLVSIVGKSVLNFPHGGGRDVLVSFWEELRDGGAHVLPERI